MKIENQKPVILVIDDDKSNIDLILNILPHYDCIPCLSGKLALDIINEENIDLILLDIMMPDMDGFEVCSIIKLKPEFEHIPIIFLSSNDTIDSINHGFELGAVDYVTKPFNPIELKCRIKTHIKLLNFQKSLEEKNLKLEKLNQKIKEIAKSDLEKVYEEYSYLSDDDIDLSHYLDNVSLDD